MYFHLTLKYNNDTTLKYNVRSIDTISSNVEKTQKNRHDNSIMYTKST
jgi:hypothetical protein